MCDPEGATDQSGWREEIERRPDLSPEDADSAFDRRTLAISDIEIFFVDLVRAQTALDAEEARVPRLSAEDRARADALADAQARNVWRASRIATRIVLERFAGAKLRGAAFRIEAGGRPTLGEEGPHFSVSHTDGMALVAVAGSIPVGVDIEAAHRPVRMSTDRRRRITAAASRLASQPSLSPEEDWNVLSAWVQLEAAAKALGIGIGRLLTEEGVVGGSQSRTSQNRPLMVRRLALPENCIGAIAAKTLPDDLAVRAFPFENIDAFLQGQSS